ncbi:ESX-1 secretion-associated protein EspE [Folsomia candida]|uniref:ESX-1 secretion-associated protein EspE n=1 Tax=Folsomia candida TaxID=158441 RepID=A0A226DC89_FOLCA|nr:ESX-1 secretion-associated protein EspE [Folsomia candida]
MLLTYFPTAAHRPEPTTDTLDDWAEQDFKIKRQVQPASPGVDNNLQALQNRFAYLNNTTGVGPKDAGAHNETAQHGRGFLSSLYETASSMALDAASMAADAVKGFVSGVSAGIGGETKGFYTGFLGYWSIGAFGIFGVLRVLVGFGIFGVLMGFGILWDLWIPPERSGFPNFRKISLPPNPDYPDYPRYPDYPDYPEYPQNPDDSTTEAEETSDATTETPPE